jgi:aminoglycoside phosphotransferase (APT) family kinase protein
LPRRKSPWTIVAGGEWVLRRPPRPPLPPSAHDVLREAFLLRALEGTDVRVPKVLATCDDEALLGVPFYVMERIEGVVLSDTLPEGMHPQRICDELIDALVEVHAVDWRAAGLEGFGKPTGYLERQVRRFTGLWEHNATRELPDVDAVTRWLAANVPESGPATIVHGDYRLGNVMYTGEELSAIFDWELATIGDPLADIGYLLATYAQPDDPPSIVASLTTVTRREGFPTREALVARYEERSGRAMTAVPWYTTLALWKSAIFLEGSYKRRLAGSTDDPFFDRLKDGVPAIAQRARQTASA